VARAGQLSLRPRGLLAVLAVSFVLHAVVWAGFDPLARARPAAGGAAGSPAVTVRFVEAPAPAPAAPPPEPVTTVAAAGTDGEATAPPAAALPELPAFGPEAALSPGDPYETPIPAPSMQATLPGPGGDADGLDWLPRSMLSVVPRPLGPVDIPFPPQVPGVLDLTTQLSLFIDADGVVQRVRVDGAPLPPLLEDAARQTFLHTRFSPGERDGRAVRAWIRVEVRFESRAAR
jgi:hypothetical protein